MNLGDGPVRERSGGTDRERSGRQRDADREVELMLGIRRAEVRALREFASRFDPILLDQARAAEGPSATDARPPSEELMRAVLERCSAEDRQLLVWSSHRVPLRDCAAWLGISYDSAKQRLSRLRARLVRESIAHLSQLGDEDRAVLLRLLRRAGVAVDTDNTRGTAA